MTNPRLLESLHAVVPVLSTPQMEPPPASECADGSGWMGSPSMVPLEYGVDATAWTPLAVLTAVKGDASAGATPGTLPAHATEPVRKLQATP
jgi:hypothetical protein